MAPCRRCETDLLHCHGTLVRHASGEVECSDPGCAGKAGVHDFVIGCDDVQSGCCESAARRAVRRPIGTARSA